MWAGLVQLNVSHDPAVNLPEGLTLVRQAATGAAYWHAPLRGRAPGTGCFVAAPGQTGDPSHFQGSRLRRFCGRGLAMTPLAGALVDGGACAGMFFADPALDQGAQARPRVPPFSHDRSFAGLA